MIISKSPAGKYVLGIDLDGGHCQISYLHNRRARFSRGLVGGAPGISREPVTLSTAPGREAFNIPMALCRLGGQGGWLFGQEAVDAAREGAGDLVTGLLDLAQREEPVRVGGEEYSPSSLLALYLRRCLSLLEPAIIPEQVAAIACTCARMDLSLRQAILRAFARLETVGQEILCEDHEESFYHYMLMQDADQRRAGMLLCEYGADGDLAMSMLLCNRRTSPVAYWAEAAKDRIDPDISNAARDRAFAIAVQGMLQKNDASAAYLAGEGFQGGWLRDAAASLCRGRRVFMGENLFSKGAAYGALLAVDRPEDVPETVFLSAEALKSNIGIEVLRREQAAYHVLLDAGTKWYEAEAEEEFILESGREFYLLQTPVTGGGARELALRLDGLPDRPDRATRLRVALSMPGPGRLRVETRDLGFGEIFPSAGGQWEAEFEV